MSWRLGGARSKQRTMYVVYGRPITSCGGFRFLMNMVKKYQEILLMVVWPARDMNLCQASEHTSGHGPEKSEDPGRWYSNQCRTNADL